MKSPIDTWQSLSPFEKTKITLVSGFLAILLLILGVLIGTLLRRSGFQLSLPALQSLVRPASPAASISPTVSCDSQIFELGGTTFHVQNLALSPDGSVTLPSTNPGVAYWMETTQGNHLIILSPTPENISLQTTLTAENTAKITWADCSSRSYSLTVPEPNPANISMLLNQLTPGLTIFVQTDTAGNGIIVRGELTELTFPQ